jgi:hypothetical protein
MSMDLEAFIEAIRPTIEADIDAQIEAEPDPAARKLMRFSRAMVIDKALDATRIANLQAKLGTAEDRLARLEPQLVKEGP